MHSNYNLLTLSDSRLLNSNGQTIYYKERIEGRNMKITDTIKYVGVNDHQVDLFEGQYAVPNGMAYNSYVILRENFHFMADDLPLFILKPASFKNSEINFLDSFILNNGNLPVSQHIMCCLSRSCQRTGKTDIKRNIF